MATGTELLLVTAVPTLVPITPPTCCTAGAAGGIHRGDRLTRTLGGVIGNQVGTRWTKQQLGPGCHYHRDAAQRHRRRRTSAGLGVATVAAGDTFTVNGHTITFAAGRGADFGPVRQQHRRQPRH